MTPAAALSQAALEATPAYAAEGDTTEEAIPLNSSTAQLPDKNANKPSNPEATGWTAVEVVKPAYDAPFVYNGEPQQPDAAEAAIYAQYSYYTTGEVYNQDWYKVSGDDVAVAYAQVGGSGTSNHAGVGNYTATYTVKNTVNTNNAGTDAALNGMLGTGQDKVNNVLAFAINKAEAKIVAAPSKAVLGVTTYKELCEQFALQTGDAPELASTDLDIKMTVGEQEITTPASNTNKVNSTADIAVEAALNTAAAKNYELSAEGGKWTGTVVVGAATEGTYAVSYTDNKLAAAGLTKTGAASAKAEYGDAKLTLANLNAAVGLSYAAPGEDPESLDASTYEVTWYNGDVKLVDDQGAKLAPVNPGVYTGNVNLKGSDEVIGQMSLTVYADLATQVKSNANDNAKPITVTVDGRYPDDVKLQLKEGITKQDLIDQVLDSMTVTLKDGTKITGRENIEALFSFSVTTFAASEGAKGVIQMGYAGDKGEYVGAATLDYSFGATLPEAPQLDPVVYNPNGYQIKKLLPSFEDESGQSFTADDDYDVSVYVADAEGELQPSENVFNVGTYRVTVTPKGDNVGPVQERTLTIEKFSVADNNASYLWDGKTIPTGTFSTTFTGDAVTPEPSVTVKLANDSSVNVGNSPTKLLNIVSEEEYNEAVKAGTEAGIDGYVTYANNTNATEGGATATVTYVGNYEGEKVQNFTIAPKKLTGAVVKAQNRLAADFPAFPTAADVLNPVVTLDGETLVQGVDYEIVSVTGRSASGNTLTYAFGIQGKGNYTGGHAGEFNVCEKDIADATAALVNEDELFFYDGDIHAPAVVVNEAPAEGSTAPGAKLVEGTDYTVSYENNVDAGTAAAVITGMGDYAGEARVEFEIQPLQLDGASADGVALDGADGLVYNGKAFEPDVLWGESGFVPANEGYGDDPLPLLNYVDDLKVSYENNVNASASGAPAYVVLSGKTGNFEGELKVPFQIAPAELAADNVSVAGPVAPGASAADAVKVTFGDAILAAGTDYTVEAEGTLPGTVKATVSGVGNFTGKVTKDVEVLYDLGGVTFEVAGTTYNGKAQTPVVTAAYYTAGGEKVAVPAEAYAQAAGSYVDAGDYTAKFSGNEAAGWTGEATASFSIAKAQGPKTVTVTYDAAGLPVVTVPGLVEGVDFTVAANPAQGKITVTYKGNYTGTATVDYKPVPAPTPTPAPVPAKDGWVGSGNDWSYYENGVQVKGGWKWIDNAWYHFEANGQMTNTQWFQDADGTWYLLNQSHKGSYGAMLTGWQKVDGGWYYLNKSGAMQSGWVKDGGEWYLLNTKHDGSFGKMLTGWQLVGGKWYYLEASGAMASSEWVGPYWVNASGVWTATR